MGSEVSVLRTAVSPVSVKERMNVLLLGLV